MRTLIISAIAIVASFAALAQQDTVYLEEVQVVVPRLLKYTYGGNTGIIDKKISNQSLNELIAENASVYFKNYGNGQLSTVVLRGTSAAHTAVIWNGIQVNSPTLGQTDFSLWPSYLLDNIAFHLGGSSPGFGSGAVGGSVFLSQSESTFENNLGGNINLETGSFGNHTTAGTIFISNQKLASQTKVYRKSIDNDFNILSENRRQNNAAILRYGFDQQFNYRINNRQFVKFEALYIYNHRQIQPSKFNVSSTEELLDKNLRLSLNYRNESGKGIWNTTFGYIIDDQRFNISTKNKTSQAALISSYDLPLGKVVSLKSGLSYSNFKSDIDAFITQVNENRIDTQIALNFTIKDWWHLSTNLRKGFYTNRTFPFVPSIGQEIEIVKKKNAELTLKSLFSKSFRIPTLNDRFWGSQGNPNLLPESGKHGDIGLVWNVKKKMQKFSTSITHFRSWIKELIIWLPTGNSEMFVPQNNREVNISGLEFSTNWSALILDGKVSTRLNYVYTKSTNQKGFNTFDQTGVNKQLPYTPFHIGNISVKYEKKGWKINSFFEFTGERFTTLDNSSFNRVKGYNLINLDISKLVVLGSTDIIPYFKLNNITNNNYENFKNYAMPGRNFLIGIDFNI